MYATNKVIIIIILVLSIPLIAAGELSFSLFFFFLCFFTLLFSYFAAMLWVGHFSNKYTLFDIFVNN